jgi:hypothetical protein
LQRQFPRASSRLQLLWSKLFELHLCPSNVECLWTKNGHPHQ